MDQPEPEKPKRRPRYAGKNPRRFDQKYKEHDPGRYAGDVAKVVAAGKTPAGMHRPILVAETLRALDPRPGDVAIDATLGHGGHAERILAAIRPGGRLIGLDADPIELPRAEARLLGLGFARESLSVHRVNFAALPRIVAAEAPGGADLILADLGLSSMQIDDPARGFGFKVDGPLDMRMDPTRGRPASGWLSTLGEARLARVLAENADEPRAAEIAAAILRAHDRRPLLTTAELARAIRDASPGRPDAEVKLAIRRVFQAIRIAVNGEFDALDALLRALPNALKPGGRAAILTFHSGEDRRVKLAFAQGLQDGLYRAVEGPIRPTAEERRDNPRSTSAKLRSAVRA